MVDWFPKLQIAITAVIALAAAIQWSAEERLGNHDLFLGRLAASKTADTKLKKSWRD